MNPPNALPSRLPRFLAATLAVLALPALAQIPGIDFDSGSNGSLGDVVITNHTTIVLPPDGILHYRSLHLANDSVLSFIRNAHNTPVYLLSQGDVIIEGAITVAGEGSATVHGPGRGGPGGFDGGHRGLGEVPPGDGQGPGGGRAGSEGGPGAANSAGAGSYLTQRSAGTTNTGAIYGNGALIPLLGGSGGGGTPSTGGGGGGGAILIASGSRIAFGAGANHRIDATGGEWGTAGAWNGGSGGAVKLVAPTITGVTRVQVHNRNGTGGSGRIRFDAISYAGANFANLHPPESFRRGSMLATGLEGALPRLELVSVAGRPIPAGAGASGFVLLPNGSSPDQPVVVRAHNFGTRLDVSVVVQPDQGSTLEVPLVIDNTTANPATATVTVPVPANTPVKINAWTR